MVLVQTRLFCYANIKYVENMFLYEHFCISIDQQTIEQSARNSLIIPLWKKLLSTVDHRISGLWNLRIKYFIIARWIKWNSFTTKYHVQSGRRNVDPRVNAGHQSSISLSGIWDCSPSVGYHFRYWLHQGEVVSSFLFSSRLSSIDFFPSPPLDFVAGLQSDAYSLHLNAISLALWALRAKEEDIF